MSYYSCYFWLWKIVNKTSKQSLMKTLISSILRQRHLFIRDLQIGGLHRQLPVLKVVVEIEALVHHNLFVSLQQTDGNVYQRLVRSECVVEVPDVHRQVLQSGLSKYGAVVAQVDRLSAVQVDLGVIGLSSAGQFGSQLAQLPVCAVDKLGTVVRLKPHLGVGAGVRPDRPRLVVDAGLVVVLDPAGHVVKLDPWRKRKVLSSHWVSTVPSKADLTYYKMLNSQLTHIF